MASTAAAAPLAPAMGAERVLTRAVIGITVRDFVSAALEAVEADDRTSRRCWPRRK